MQLAALASDPLAEVAIAFQTGQIVAEAEAEELENPALTVDSAQKDQNPDFAA